MAQHGDGNERDGSPTGDAGSDTGSTLLPMLVGGLVLVVVGAVIVMTFV
jgi:hypothetical protein